MAKYKGSVELISGLTQKNGGDFPLMDAHAIQVDDTGKRLDEKLSEIGTGGGGSGESYGIRPEDYGAKGDGVSDDHDAIVAAMNAAVAQRKPLSFSGGKTYLIKTYWELASNLTVEGHGAVILTNLQNGVGWQSSAVRIAGANDGNWCRNVTVKDLEIRPADDCPSQYVLQMLRCADIVLSHVTLTCELNLHDERRCCFDIYGAFENILFENCVINQLSGVLEGGCWVREWRTNGVSRNIRFINCDFIKAGADEVFAVWGWRGIIREALVSGCTFREIEDAKYWTNERFRPYWYITLGQSAKRGNNEMSTEIQFVNNVVRSSHCECVFRMLGEGTHAVVDNCDFYITQDALVPSHENVRGANMMLAQGNSDPLHTIIRNCRGTFQGDCGRRLTYQIGTVENCAFDVEGLAGVFSSTDVVRGNIITGRDLLGAFNDCRIISGNKVTLENTNPQIFAGYSRAENNDVEIDSPDISAQGFAICTSGSWGGSIFKGNRVNWNIREKSAMGHYQFIDATHFVFDNIFTTNGVFSLQDRIPGYLYRRNNYFNGLPEKIFPCTGIAFDSVDLEVSYKKKMEAAAAPTPENCTDPIVYEFSGADGVMELSGHGKYRAIADGKVAIKATCGSYETTQWVTVKLLPAPCETLVLSRRNVKCAVDRPTYIKANYTPYWTTDILVYSSSDEEVVSITQSGEITAHKLGNAKIIATCGDKRVECPVEVVDASMLPVYADGEWLLDNTVAYVPLPSVGESHTLYIEMTVDLDSITEARGRVPLFTTAENGQENGSAPVSLDFIKTNGLPTYDWGTTDSGTANGGKGIYYHVNYINTGVFDEESGAAIRFLFKPDGVYNSGMESPIWATLENEYGLQQYSGYLFFNQLRSAEDKKLQSCGSSAELKAALEAGEIHAGAAKGYKIKQFILYSHDLYTTTDEIIKYREGADIDIRFDESGMPVNAGTSGMLVWSSGNSAADADGAAAELGKAKLGTMKLK